ncbi:MAG: hypothetical protein KF725_00400 [Cyclobacteriaceae bacterium]|nr:hypothetical protein [Cyclobacteriaceae bacterium]UYN87075.1 MAG: hypothetical protein KIT51_02005 [Cyclobacteriaceae bacterium]
MPLSKYLIVLNLCLLSATSAWAQRPKVHHGGKLMHTRTQHNYNVIRVPRSKAKTICPIFEDTGYPYHGLGVKLGDPFAVTYKYYANKHFSFGLDFGRSASGLYSSYYRQVFNEFTRPDTLQENQTTTYLAHRAKSDFVGEIKVLYHIKADKISQGLQAYAGLGWEWRSLNIQYDYLLNDGILDNKIQFITRSRFTYGAQGTLGIEYSYFKMPVSAFMELEVFVDLLRDPGFYKIQGGVGLRYIF